MNKRTFTSYLTESDRTYHFRIKLANMPEGAVVDSIETALEKYELKSLSKPKKTPIQEHPMDFQTINNAEVHIMDAEVKYPTTADVLFNYLADSVGIPHKHLVVINKDHPEEIAREEAVKNVDEEYAPLLGQEHKDMEKSDGKAEDASGSFGDKFNDNMLKSLQTRKYEFAKE
jgi:hypothetical protein|tara:strand:+ start:626 stop:1144 length:519 start_codon:yes stop_codon:yes gene_type:complete